MLNTDFTRSGVAVVVFNMRIRAFTAQHPSSNLYHQMSTTLRDPYHDKNLSKIIVRCGGGV